MGISQIYSPSLSSQAKKRYHRHVQDPASQPPVQPVVSQGDDSQSRLVSKLRSSMNPGAQKIMQGLGGGDVGKVTTPASPPPQVAPSPSSQASANSQQSDLDVLDEVISELESSSVVAQALPTAVTQVADQQLNPPIPTPVGATAKERAEAASPDAGGVVEVAQAIQYVEHEPSPEIPPEVDGFLKRAQDHSAQAPKEIVIADGSTDAPVENSVPSQPVVVLPITEETEQKAKHKSPKLSIRWLVEWSHKIMKKFVGRVIYREK
jgi:hypothetical protein